MMQKLKDLQPEGDVAKKDFVCSQWRQLPQAACLVFNKLLMGGFRIGVSQNLIIKALASYSKRDLQEVAHMLSGDWEPYTATFPQLMTASLEQADDSKPYPFYLAYPLEKSRLELGPSAHWQVEWKWDGIRGQLIHRGGSVYLWSRGEELLDGRFPEIELAGLHLPAGTVLDGEILAYRNGLPISFQYLQTRIQRKKVTKKQLDEAPVVFMAYDLLEWQGADWRQRPLAERRRQLESLVANTAAEALIISPIVDFQHWNELDPLLKTARERACEGFMIKKKDSVYQAGRRRGDWWKWKIDPLSVDAVMIYAQKGHGKRSGLYTDYTFAVQDGEKLVPFAKAYSGLTDKEIAQVDKFVKANSLEQFGPVRTVKPELVFEIGFEGIGASPRHKSGIAVRFPRILKWRTDKTRNDIDTLQHLKSLLELYGKS